MIALKTLLFRTFLKDCPFVIKDYKGLPFWLLIDNVDDVDTDCSDDEDFSKIQGLY